MVVKFVYDGPGEGLEVLVFLIQERPKVRNVVVIEDQVRGVANAGL